MVSQKTKSDCGLVAVANALGLTYAEVKRAFGRMSRAGMSISDIQYLLNHFRTTWRRTTPQRPPRPEEWLSRHPSGRFVLAQGGFLYGDGHYFACVDGKFLGYYVKNWTIAEYWSVQ